MQKGIEDREKLENQVKELKEEKDREIAELNNHTSLLTKENRVQEKNIEELKAEIQELKAQTQTPKLSPFSQISFPIRIFRKGSFNHYRAGAKSLNISYNYNYCYNYNKMPQQLVYTDKKEDALVIKHSKFWKISKAETIKKIIKEYGKLSKISGVQHE